MLTVVARLMSHDYDGKHLGSPTPANYFLNFNAANLIVFKVDGGGVGKRGYACFCPTWPMPSWKIVPRGGIRRMALKAM